MWTRHKEGPGIWTKTLRAGMVGPTASHPFVGHASEESDGAPGGKRKGQLQSPVSPHRGQNTQLPNVLQGQTSFETD